MTNEQKHALIEHIETDLELLRNVTLKHCHEFERECVLRDIEVNEIALAALTAQPVKLPAPYGMQDHERWLKQSEVESAIRAAGYEVQE